MCKGQKTEACVSKGGAESTQQAMSLEGLRCAWERPRMMASHDKLNAVGFSAVTVSNPIMCENVPAENSYRPLLTMNNEVR